MKRNRRAKIALIALLTLASANWVCTPPSWVVQAEQITRITLPIFQTILTIVSPNAAPKVNQVTADIGVLLNLFDLYQSTPQAGTLTKIQAAINAINSDIQQIMAASHVSNPATQAKITAILQLVASEFNQIAALLPAPVIAARVSGAPPVVRKAGKLPFTASEFKAHYNRIVTSPTGDPECDAAFKGKELK